MFKLYADKNNLTVQERERVTSGSVNVYQARFEFSADWEGLAKTAVFRCGGADVAVVLDESGECAVPWEVLQTPGFRLEAGICGTRGGEVVLPTKWASLGMVLEGAGVPKEARPPTPELWQQLLERKGDRMGYTEAGELGLFSGDRLLSSVPVSGGGGEGGVSDHRFLTGRDAPEQHPVGAISGLEKALANIPVPMTADQLRKILMNGGQ